MVFVSSTYKRFRQVSSLRVLVLMRVLREFQKTQKKPELTTNSTYVDILSMARAPNTSAQTRSLLGAMIRHSRSWQYGYELSKQTGLKSGTLYPLLIRLSDQGLLESKWQEPEQPGKPARHAYKLTVSGLALGREIAATLAPAVRKLVGATT